VNLYGYVLGNPINRIDPRGLFEYYGNWGGPNWTGRYEKSWDQMTAEERWNAEHDPLRVPITPQDWCYHDHDVCYGEAREVCAKCGECSNGKLNECDKKLRNCLINIGLSDSVLDEAYRVTAITVFYLQPAVRNATEENKENASNWLLTIKW